ncbi:MAG: twin-arginine translocase subunit TatC [Clostridia bacterium]|nr:twin-arginine translocase subunit TatC [Clostridia bacterium]
MDQPNEKQSILEHLAALRKILLVSAGAVLAAFVVIFYAFIDPLMGLITQPIVERGIEIIYTAMSEALMTKLKVALVAAVVVASPVIFWQLWGFIKPALYPNEKRAVRLIFFVAVFLFLLGVMFCYFAVYMLAVDFFLISGENLAVPMLSIDKYVGFLFGFVLPFGLAFELPVALYITTRLGMTNYEMLAGKRKFVILAVAVIAAVLTPPDVVSQVMLGIPILLLFEVGLLVVKHVRPKQAE